MKNSDTTRIVELLTELSESINGPRQREAGHKTKRPLSDRIDELDKKVDKLDNRVSEVQLGLATLAADTKAQFKRIDDRFERVDKRFDRVDRSIESSRVQLVDLVTRVHSELTGRIVDLEEPGPGGRGGGGSGSGGSGVPLAS